MYPVCCEYGLALLSDSLILPVVHMDAVILAAGTGSRLRPLTIDRPKACVTVDGVPIGEHQLRAYDAAGFETVSVVTGYMADRI